MYLKTRWVTKWVSTADFRVYDKPDSILLIGYTRQERIEIGIKDWLNMLHATWISTSVLLKCNLSTATELNRECWTLSSQYRKGESIATRPSSNWLRVREYITSLWKNWPLSCFLRNFQKMFCRDFSICLNEKSKWDVD